jgi:phosphatidylcholine synthase
VSAPAAQDASPIRQTLAWGVHAFTASGAVIGALALLAIAGGDLSRAALLMLLALAIDSVDGTLARAVRVRDVLPTFDGRRLDDMVDFLNYVIVPAVFLVWAGSLLSWHWAALPILASAYGFSQDDAKTEDDFFLGFPSYWNVVALYLWRFDVSPLAGTVIVALFSAMVFVPFKFLYPSRAPVLRRTTNIACAVWTVALAGCVLDPAQTASIHLLALTLLFPVYYFVLSFWLGGLHRSRS